MKIAKMSFVSFLIILVLLPSCMRVPTYHRHSLHNVNTKFDYRNAERGVILQAKQLTIPEIQYLFGLGSAKLSKTFAVLYISIHNLSNIAYTFSPDNFDIELATYDDVIKSVKKTSTASRLTGAALSGIIVSPIPFDFWLFCIASSHHLPSIVLAPFVVAGIIAIPLGITFLAQGIKSAVMNSRIKKDFKEKTFHQKVDINAGEKYEGLVFVKLSDYQPKFTITMHEKYTMQNNIVFNVNVHQNE
ncbi:MAG TPA: hypothetical protein VLB80_05125 [Candidatus Babeliales bacterium]|nr:hypothetical protein [Candidatus Babeliales bacterium]